MKTEMYKFDGTSYRPSEIVTLTFNVALDNLSNFISLLGNRSHTVDKTLYNFYGSSKSYIGKTIVVKCSAWSMFNLMLQLGCKEYSEVRDNVHVNYGFLSNKRTKFPQLVLIFSKSKGYYVQERPCKVDYKSVFTKGKEVKHIVPIN